MGAANGAVSTATGVFMIPVIPYIQSLGLKRDDMVQAQGISFTVSTLVADEWCFCGNGTLNAANAGASLLVAVAVTFAGMLLGQHVRKFVHPGAVPVLVLPRNAVARVHLLAFSEAMIRPIRAELRQPT